ncbi:MAG: serine/threonine protein kinase [Myxococcales bacterium]|nr:serine/threonine protein kinase [Myxococcales bacterium]
MTASSPPGSPGARGAVAGDAPTEASGDEVASWPAPRADELRAGDELAGRYRVVRALGQGAHGRVYEMEDRELGRRVAVKLLGGQRGGVAARFRREARLAAALTHEHVAAVYDAGALDDGRLFIAMELCPGESLARVLDAEGALDERRAVRLALQIARGLGAAHARGIIHRDVKPANLMVATRPDGEHVKIVDFGVSKQLAGDARDAVTTADGAVIGSPAYMAPEQARGDEVDHRADVYALGAVLYELVTGRLPHPAASPMAVLARVLSDEPTPPRVVRPGLSADVEAIIARAMAKDRAARYPDMATFAADLAALLAGEALAATAPPRRRRATRGVVVIAALLAASVAVTLALNRGGRARRDGAAAVGEDAATAIATAPDAAGYDPLRCDTPPAATAEERKRLGGELYDRATAAYTADDFERAALDFQRAHCEVAWPSMLGDQAQAWARARRYDRALAAIEAYVAALEDGAGDPLDQFEPAERARKLAQARARREELRALTGR